MTTTNETSRGSQRLSASDRVWDIVTSQHLSSWGRALHHLGTAAVVVAAVYEWQSIQRTTSDLSQLRTSASEQMERLRALNLDLSIRRSAEVVRHGSESAATPIGVGGLDWECTECRSVVTDRLIDRLQLTLGDAVTLRSTRRSSGLQNAPDLEVIEEEVKRLADRANSWLDRESRQVIDSQRDLLRSLLKDGGKTRWFHNNGLRFDTRSVMPVQVVELDAAIERHDIELQILRAALAAELSGRQRRETLVRLPLLTLAVIFMAIGGVLMQIPWMIFRPKPVPTSEPSPVQITGPHLDPVASDQNLALKVSGESTPRASGSTDE